MGRLVDKEVFFRNEQLTVPVGSALLGISLLLKNKKKSKPISKSKGRALNALGAPLDGKPELSALDAINASRHYVPYDEIPCLFPPIPSLSARSLVSPNHRIHTGLKAVDLFSPFARGVSSVLHGPMYD